MGDKSYGTESGNAGSGGGQAERLGGAVAISKEDIQRVVSAGKIPDEEVQHLEFWLASKLHSYRTLYRGIDGRTHSEGPRIKHLENILKASRRLDELLSVSWVKEDMWSYEREKAWKALNEGHDSKPRTSLHGGILTEALGVPKFEYDSPVVDDDFLAVERLMDRSKQLIKEYKRRANHRKHLKDRGGAPNTGLRILTVYICGYWSGQLRQELTIEQNSPFAAFADEVFRLAGCRAKAWETLKERLITGARIYRCGPWMLDNYYPEDEA